MRRSNEPPPIPCTGSGSSSDRGGILRFRLTDRPGAVNRLNQTVYLFSPGPFHGEDPPPWEPAPEAPGPVPPCSGIPD